MADYTVGVLFKGSFSPSIAGQLGNIEFDAVVNEEHEWTADATSNPVEDGAPVSDHIIEQADRIKIRAVISDTPLRTSTSADAAMAEGDITQPAFDLIRRLMKARELVTVYTRFLTYENMAVTDVSIPRSSRSDGALEMDISLVHIRTVATETVDVPPGISAKKEAKKGGKKGATAKKSEPTKPAGKKQATATTKPAAASKPTSALYSLAN